MKTLAYLLFPSTQEAILALRRLCAVLLTLVPMIANAQETRPEKENDERLNEAFEAIVQNDFKRSKKLLESLQIDLNRAADSLIMETQLAEAEMLKAIAEYLDSNSSFLNIANSLVLFRNASQRFVRNWQPENQVQQPSLEELLCLKSALDRLQRAPKEQLKKLPKEVMNYFTVACYDAGRLFLDRSFIESRECFEASLFFWNATNPKGIPDRSKINIHSALSIILNRAGSTYEALNHALIAVESTQALSPKDRTDDDLAGWRINLGAVYEELGDFESAKAQYDIAVELMEKTLLLSDDPTRDAMDMLASGLGHLASLDLEEGRPEDALDKYHRILKIRLDSQSPPGELARLYHNIAGAYSDCLLFDHAKYWFQLALDSKLRIYTSDKYPYGHVSLARTLHLLSEVHLLSEDPIVAEMYSLFSIRMREACYPNDIFPNGHEELVESWLLLGRIQSELSRVTEANASIARAVDMAKKIAQETLSFATLNDSINHLDQMNRARDVLLELPDNIPSDVSSVYNSVWDSKGFVSRILRHRNIFLSRSSDPELEAYRRFNEDINDNLSRLVASTNVNSQEGKDTIKALRDKHRLVSLEFKPVLDLKTGRLDFTFVDLLKLLKSDEVFVDIVYSRPRLKTRDIYNGSYYAFVLRPGDSEPRRIFLGQADDLDSLIADFVRSITDRSEMHRPTGDLLSDKVWSKVQSEFPSDSDVSRVYIATDGAFDKIPWDALPSLKGNKFLIEDFDITHVIHGALLTEQLSRKRPSKPSQTADVLAIGHIQYGEPEHLDPSEAFEDLPDSEEEIRTIEEVFSSAEIGSIIKLTGENARLEDVIDHLRTSSISHFATHMVDGISRSKTSQNSTRKKYLSIEASGIALANSNRTSEGVLRGGRIAALPLANSSLVNLSGCYSAVGEISLGNTGVSSLEHAFQLAGTQVTVSSIWEADSTATSFLMSNFYRNLLKSSAMDASQSLRTAKIKMMQHGPASDCDHPYYWAGWRANGYPCLQLSLPIDSLQGNKSNPLMISEPRTADPSDKPRLLDSRIDQRTLISFFRLSRIPLAIILLLVSGTLFFAATRKN